MKVYFIRNQWVMLDKDLAALINRNSRQINQTANRNSLSEDYCFKLTKTEFVVIDPSYDKGGHSKTVYTLKGSQFIVWHFTNSLQIRYNENLFEKQVVSYLKKDGYIKQANKPMLFNQIPDYIFTKDKIPYIVEIQVGVLDKQHLYRLVEYRDLYFQKYNIKPKLIMICEGFKKKHEFALKIHEIEIIILNHAANNPKIKEQKSLKDKDSVLQKIESIFSQTFG